MFSIIWKCMCNLAHWFNGTDGCVERLASEKQARRQIEVERYDVKI